MALTCSGCRQRIRWNDPTTRVGSAAYHPACASRVPPRRRELQRRLALEDSDLLRTMVEEGDRSYPPGVVHLVRGELLRRGEEIRAPRTSCPFCEGRVSRTARKCRHCGEWIEEESVALPTAGKGEWDSPLVGLLSVTLIVAGVGWALYGATNIFGTLASLDGRPTDIHLLGVWANIVLFVLPGLAFGAIGGIGLRLKS